MPEVEPEPVITEEEFTLKTGETIRVTKYVYEYPEIFHIMYDVFLRTPKGMSHIWRAVESILNDKDRQ